MIGRLLIVGLGSIGSRHLRLARSLLPDAKIVVLRHRGCAGENAPGVDHCVSSLEEAMRFHPEAAVIANPASRHLDVALPLAAAGVHLLVEKPISSSAGGVGELIATCQARGVRLMIGYNLRFSPSLQEFRRLIGASAVGRVLSVRAEVGQSLESWRPGTDYRTSVSASATLGGGVLLELSHEVDYLRWIFGDVHWVSAILRKQSRLDIDVEDTAHLIVGFALKTDGAEVAGSLNMDFIRRDATRSCTVIGETGSLRWDGIAGSVSIFEKDAVEWRHVFSHKGQRDDTYVAEWHHFLACIEDGVEPVVSGYDGLAVVQVVEAARASSITGTIVSLPQPRLATNEERLPA